VAWGGLVRWDHGDGGSGGAPASTCTARRLTGLEQRALAGAGSRWEGGDAVAVMEKRLGAACAINDDGGVVVPRLQLLRPSGRRRRSWECETEGVDRSERVLGW